MFYESLDYVMSVEQELCSDFIKKYDTNYNFFVCVAYSS